MLKIENDVKLSPKSSATLETCCIRDDGKLPVLSYVSKLGYEVPNTGSTALLPSLTPYFVGSIRKWRKESSVVTPSFTLIANP